MRILFSACPLSGHITTILPLALAARSAGHSVVVASGADVVSAARRHGLETWAAGGAAPVLPGGGTTAQRSAFFASSAAGRAAELVPRAEIWGPDLVISDTAEVAGVVTAAVTGARLVVHGLGIMPPMVLWNAYAVHVDGLLARWGVPASADGVREATYLDVCPPALRRRGEPIWSRTLDLRPATVPSPPLPLGLDSVAPFAARSSAAGPDKARRGPAGARDMILASIDGLPHRDTVLARPGSPADAAAILSAVRGRAINLVLLADPADFGNQPANVLIARDLPDAAVLPRCRALVSPGGPGVALAALAYGLPQLVLTQETTAADGDVTHAGAALTVNATNPAAVERAVRDQLPRLLDDPAFAASAAWVQVEIAAMSSPEAVVRTLTSEGVPALR